MHNLPLFLGKPPGPLLEMADPVALVLLPGIPVAVEVLLEPLVSLQPGPLLPGPLVAVKVLAVSLPLQEDSLAAAELLPGHPLVAEGLPGPIVELLASLLLVLLTSSLEGKAISC